MTSASASRAVWLRRRAANVRRRPNLVGGIACVSFAVLLAALFASAPSVWRVPRTLSMPARPRPDTMALLRDVARAAARLDTANAALARASAAARRVRRTVPTDTIPASRRARRDSLRTELATLGTLLARAKDAPLPASYRALGATPHMRTQPRVVMLLDSLAVIEQTRAAFDATGGVDPVFVALTARAAAIGQEIRELALATYAGLRLQLAAITPVAPPRRAPVVVPDMTPLRAARDSATADRAAAADRLARARIVSRALDEEAARARARLTMGAPPLALLAAAAVLALVAGFTAALVLELREPSIAGAMEAEEATRAPVLAIIRPQRVIPERARRQADRELPPLVHPSSDTYQPLYAQLAERADLPMIGIVGDHPMVTAVVAANLAAVAARQPRATLLVDTDVGTRALATVTRVATAPGLADVLERRIEWSEAIAPMIVGRDCTMDVLPSGTFATEAGRIDAGTIEALRIALAHLGRRYETVVVHAPVSSVGRSAAVSPVVICARVGRTSLAALTARTAEITAGGASVSGVVLWEMSDPPAPPSRVRRDEEPVAAPAPDTLSLM